SNTASSARAVAGGGISVALANEAIASSVGMDITMNAETSLEALLFSEGGARAIYSVPADKCCEFERIWAGFPCRKIGSASGCALTLNGILDIPLSTLKKTFLEGK
ncbi:MAG: phosphoribosylformylglycinamidine synthase subunit PurL, partial [Synergistaceae bacterium]